MIAPPQELKLTPEQRLEPLWRDVVDAYCEKQIERLRAANDNAALTYAETCALRGQLKAYKAVRALGVDRAMPDVSPPL